MKYDNHAATDDDDNDDHDSDDNHAAAADDDVDHDATGDSTYHLDVLEPLLYPSHVLSGDASVLCTSAMPPQLS